MTIPVSNLHDFPLENVCVDMFTPDLAIIGDRLHCVNLEAGETKLVCARTLACVYCARFSYV